MKKLLLLALMITGLSNAQSEIHFGREVYNNVNFILDYGTVNEKSFNGAIEYDWVSKWGYIKPAIQILPKINYTDVNVAFGLNIEKGRIDTQWRLYTGVKLGHIWRTKASYPLFGVEIGLDKKIIDHLYIGGRISNDWREDFKASGADPAWQFNGGLKISYRFEE